VETFESLLLYREFAESDLVGLVNEVRSHDPGPSAAALYARLFARLASEASPQEDPWRHHVRRAILREETPFARAARTGGDSPSPGLREAMRRDLRILESLHAIDGDEVARRLSAGMPPLPSWRSLGSAGSTANGIEGRLMTSAGWDDLVDELWEHFRANSAGALSDHVSFRWSGAALEPVPRPDPIRLSDLIGYEDERTLLIENTEVFAAGYRANNVLLYGPRGTGKSSTVRALVNEFGRQGLRLVQIERPHLAEFPRIVAELRDRPERFILFLDDLAFEVAESEYAHLKGLLEGGLETKPDNCVVYSTSNRRHLVDERWSDREEPDDVVHVTDTYQHKLSLADRFGIRILFPAPDQARYLMIVEELARRQGLDPDGDDLGQGALRWSLANGGFSPRGARQYVDHLAGRAAFEARRADPRTP